MSRSKKPSPGPVQVREALLARQLDTLEDCRKLWEASGDPLALVVALTHTELPAWLRAALLVTMDPEVGFILTRKRWATRARDAKHAARALAISRVLADPDRKTKEQKVRAIQDGAMGEWLREHPSRWEFAGLMASSTLLRTDAAWRGVPTKEALDAMADTMKASYKRVRRGLQDPWAYWCPPAAFRGQRLAALEAVRQLIEHSLHSADARRRAKPAAPTRSAPSRSSRPRRPARRRPGS